MAKKKFKETASNPFDEGLSMEAADAALYGGALGLDLPDSKKPYPTDIMLLKADRAQPRRTVPLSIRGDWDGGGKAVAGLIYRWLEATEEELGVEVNIADIFKGYDKEIEADPQTQPISGAFIELVNLASNIHRTGLLNPIQINRMGKGGKINAGERRWLAHHLLVMYSDNPKKYMMIRAVDGEFDVWTQAAENGVRSPLNAIGRSRQLALLLMHLYKDDDGVRFDDFDTLVSPGGSDRAFYAQVADGRLYRAKHGDSQKIVEAMGLKSRHQISQYRNLLNLDDETWMSADEGNWTENYCRVNFLQKPVESPNEDEMLTPVNKSDDNLEVKIGQIRAVDDNEYPYIVVLEQDGADMFVCLLEYRNNESKQRMSRSSIMSKWKIIRGYADLSSIEDVSLIDDTPPATEKPLEGRDLGVGEGYSQRYEPIVDKSEDWLLPSEMGEMPTDDELAEEQVLVEEAIWDIEVDDTVTGYREPDRPIDERINMNRPPRQTEFDDHGQLRLPHTDNGDQVSFISMRGELRWLLSRVEDMARHQNMKKELDALSLVTLWTPETIRKKMTEGGRDAVDKEKKQVEDAITRVFNAMFIQFDGLLQDVEDIADQCE